MNYRKLILITGSVTVASVLLLFYEGGDGSLDINPMSLLERGALSDAQNPTVPTNINRIRGSSGTSLDSSNSRAELVLDEVRVRVREDQFDEALNELEAMLENYDSLSDEDKKFMLLGYAQYFWSQSQVEDAIFFYEAALEIPGIPQDERWALLQFSSRLAIIQEDWDKFIALNDQYFAEGGEYTWIVAENLAAVYRRLEDVDSQGHTLLLHLDVGIRPDWEGTELEYYERGYDDIHLLPLNMTDTAAALDLAQALVGKFDQLENWQVLADVLRAQGDELAVEQLLNDARNRGFLDANGEWRPPTQRRSRRLLSQS